MSLSRNLLAAGLGVAALGATATSAQAAVVPPKTLKYMCKYPLVDKQPLTVEFSTNIPPTVEVNALQPAFKVDAKVVTGGNTGQIVRSLDASKLTGDAFVTTSLRYTSGWVQDNQAVVLGLEPWLRPAGWLPGPIELNAHGVTPTWMFDETAPAQVDVTVDSLRFYLHAFKADGTEIKVKKLTTGFDGDAVPVPPDWETLPGFEVLCKLDAGENNVIATVCPLPVPTSATHCDRWPDPVDITPPSTPGAGTYTSADIGEDRLTVRWGASTDESGGSGLGGYYVKNLADGEERFVPAGTESATFTGLGSGSEYVFHIRAVDRAGNASETHEELLVTKHVDPPLPPVTGVKVTSITPTSVALTWEPVAAPPGATVVYRVYEGGSPRADTSTNTASISDLAPASTHTFRIEASVDGEATPLSEPITVTTPQVEPEQPTTLEYMLKGSTTLKTLTTGKLPLTGGIKATPDFAAGTFTADLKLNNTSGRLLAAGFLPITAKVGFVPVGKTTGTLDDATATKPAGITTNSKVRIKVLEVKLFGAIPLAGGNNCQTKQVSDITLKSTNAFDPFKGGSIAGTYKISDLNGCGALNGLVSPLTAGGGNTIALDLTYQP